MIGLNHKIALSLLPVTLISWGISAARADERWIVYEGEEGPGKGKHLKNVRPSDLK